MNTNTLESSARTKLDAAEASYSELLGTVEARIASLPNTASVADVDAIQAEYRTLLDEAEAAVQSARAQLDSASRITDARRATSLIPREDVAVRVLSEPTTYRRGDPQSPSFFQDMYMWQRSSDNGAAERLKRGTHETLVEAESRKITLRDAEGRAMSSTTGAGGDFLPPLYFGSLYADYRRARRVTANLVRNLPLAAHGNTVTVPRVTAGSLAAAQTDNSNVSNQDATTAILSIPVCTIAGYVDLSRQIVERSEPGMDEIIMEDLISSYNKQLNNYVVNGSGSSGQPKGVLGTSYNTITFTSGSPTVALLYPKLLDSLRQIQENVFRPATARRAPHLGPRHQPSPRTHQRRNA